MSLVFTSQANNNGIVYSKGSSGFKPANMSQGSMITNSTAVYNNNAGGGSGWFSSSDVIAQKRRIAIGKSQNRVGIPDGQPSTYKSTEGNSRKSALARVRGGGAVAPPKKGAQKK